MSQRQPGATIVIPTRHEEHSVGLLIADLETAFADRNGHTEVLIIDDSDNHETASAAERAKRGLPETSPLKVRVIHRPKATRTGGLSGAVIHGIDQAKAPVVLVMDGDGQHPAHTAPQLLDKVHAGDHLVVASRYIKGGSAAGLDGPWRKFVSRAATVLTRVLFPHSLRGITDPMTGFFAFKKDELDMDRLRGSKGFKILFEILALHSHLKRSEVPLQFQERFGGESKTGEGNGAEFLRQLPRLRLATLPSFVNFLVGGGMVAVVGALLLWTLVAVGTHPLVANAIQLVVTLALNFVYNRSVTWRKVSGKSLTYQTVTFGVTRGCTLVLSWFAFVGLMALETRYLMLSTAWQAQLANAICVAGAVAFNYITSKHVVFRAHHRQLHIAVRMLLAGAVLVGGTAAVIAWVGFKAWFVWFILAYALFGLMTSALEVRWRLYGRRTPEARDNMSFPPPVEPAAAACTFSIIVPALDEPWVIGGTLHKLLAQTHLHVQIVVTLAKGDDLTIGKVEEIAALHPDRIKVVTQAYEQSSKPLQLNAALPHCTGKYVTVVDAETVWPEELLLHVEALIIESGADVVQGGVQLMNLDLPRPRSWDRFQRFPRVQRALRPFFLSHFWTALRSWFCVHNVMEYFFWFSSRMFYQVDQGFVPLGGNTVFIRRELLKKVEGWPLNLTEDCALGVELSAKYNATFVAAYEPRLAAREETPSRVFGGGGLDRQRRRWVQGFLSVLLEGEWRKLPTFRQRMMAFYILAMPFVQAVNGAMLPVAIVAAIILTAPVGLVLLMFLPLLPMAMSVLIQVLGLREFSREFDQKVKFRHYLSLIVANLPYQVVLAWSALVAVMRQARGKHNWYKTQHDGAHVQAVPELIPEFVV